MVPVPPRDLPLSAEVPQTYSEALAGMVDRPYLASRNWVEQQQRAVRDFAHPDILEFERVFVRRLAKLGVPVFAPEVIRSAKRQDDLYALGNSRARGGQSAHQYGCAVDIVHSVRAWDCSPKQWQLMGHIGKELITQKGFAVDSAAWPDFNGRFYDPAHWQIVDWKNQKDDYPWQTK